MKVHFLGSMAGYPTAHATTSGMAFEKGGKYIIFDAPEGAAQSCLRYNIPFTHISSILISHMHLDHTAGLCPLLINIFAADQTKPLTLYGPKRIVEYVHQVMDLTYASEAKDYPPNFKMVELEGGEEFEAMGLKISTFKLHHVVPALGYYVQEPDEERVNNQQLRLDGFPFGLQIKEIRVGNDVLIKPFGENQEGKLFKAADYTQKMIGIKMVVCFDSSLCYDLETFEKLKGQANLLICECTFIDEDELKAIFCGHSVPKFVKQAADALGVRKIIINHFSQRYGQLEYQKEEIELGFASKTKMYNGIEVDWGEREVLMGKQGGWVRISGYEDEK